MYDKNQLKNLLQYIKLCHKFPEWFDALSNKELVEELENNGVLYTTEADIRGVMADYYDKCRTQKISVLCVNEILMKSLYEIEI